MVRIRIGITGQSGFIGTSLYRVLGLYPDVFERIEFKKDFFQEEKNIRDFVTKCDVIVHLAALNRHNNSQVIYEKNLSLVKLLINAMKAERVTPYVLFASSTQEQYNNEYGKSKYEGRIMFEQWAEENSASFTGLVIPNVYGPFGYPNYNSFIATFCYKLTHGEQPVIIQDSNVKLIYVDNLCKYIMMKIQQIHFSTIPIIERYEIPFDFEKKVTDILTLLNRYKSLYFDKGFFPDLKDSNELNLFNTFRCYIDYSTHFPVKLILHSDLRGVFVETIKLGVGGQVSFSTTVPGVTRGNHFHTRKIERFTVIKGKAQIKLRQIGTYEVLNFYLEGNKPGYVDIPIWYTHSITNIGDEELFTQFWISEWYNPEESDTYYEIV